MYVNIDINSRCTPFFNSLTDKDTVTEEDVAAFIDFYCGGNVTDILFDIFCQYSAADSKVWDSYEKKYLQKIENNIEVDYTEEYKSIFKLNKEYNIDPYDVWIKKCREIGINPWISVRMNDCHCPELEACFLRSNFFYEAKEKDWMIGEDYGYYRNAYDYSVPEVRKKMLDYIAEQLDRYDVYGIELDFMREIFCFRYIEAKTAECVGIMNDFIRSVKGIVTEAELKYGHKIKIAVRLMHDIDWNYIFGFDPRTWNKEKLVDVIIPSPRWDCSDNQIPIDAWKKELPGMQITACVETLIGYENGKPVYMNTETASGNAAIFLSQGSDGIYLFNYFGEASVGNDKRDREVYKICTSLDEIYKHTARLILIGHEDAMCPKGLKNYTPIPLNITDKEQEIIFNTGRIPQEKEQWLVIGLSGNTPNNSVIKINGKICENFEEMHDMKNIIKNNPETKFYKCRIKTDKSKQVFSFSSTHPGMIAEWLEIYVK